MICILDALDNVSVRDKIYDKLKISSSVVGNLVITNARGSINSVVCCPYGYLYRRRAGALADWYTKAEYGRVFNSKDSIEIWSLPEAANLRRVYGQYLISHE